MKRYIFIYSLLLFCIPACSDEKSKAVSIIPSEAVIIDSTASCPHLSTDTKGNIAISWVRERNDSITALCYAISADQGKTFSEPVVIPGTENINPHGENMPKVLFKPSGEIIAMWGEANPNPHNSYSGKVYYKQSFDNGSNWTATKALVTDTAGYDQRYFDMAVTQDGEAAVIWLDNRKEPGTKGSSLYFAVTNSNNGFTSEKRIGESTCECCRTCLTVAPNGNLHVLYRDIIRDSIRDMVHAVSTDGSNFSVARAISRDNWVINGCPHSGPAMVVDNNNALHFSWFTGGAGSGIYYCQSPDNGTHFSVRDSVSRELGAKHPQIAALPDGNLLVTWDESRKSGNHYISLIGLEKRDAGGRSQGKLYVSDSTLKSSFPVIKTFTNNQALIACTQTINKRNRVVYYLITLH